MPIQAPAGPIRHDRRVWHDTFRPSFTELVSLGYLEGASTYVWGSDIQGISGPSSDFCFDPTAYLSNTRADKELSDSGETVYVWCAVAGDTGKTVRLSGVDENGDYATVDVVTSFGTSVEANGLWQNVNKMSIISGSVAEGDIYCSTQSADSQPTNANNLQVIIIGGTATENNSMIMCPNDFTYLWQQAVLSSAFDNALRVKIWSKNVDVGLWYDNFQLLAYYQMFEVNLSPELTLSPGEKWSIEFSNDGGNALDATWYAGMIELRGDVTPKTANTSMLFTP